MSAAFDIDVVPAGTRTVAVRVRGVLDAQAAPALLSACRKAAAGGRHLVLNLSGVTFVSSSGIGAMLALVEEATPHSVRLAELSEAVRSVLAVLNLDAFLAIDDSEADSVRRAEAA